VSTTTTATSGGIGLGGLAFLVLFIMKITGNTDMSWFWVLTSALWLPILCVLSILALVGLVIGVVFAVAWVHDTITGR
jgi:hypothetical protein